MARFTCRFICRRLTTEGRSVSVGMQAGGRRVITDLIFTINPFPCRDFPLQGEEALKEISAKYLTVIAKKMIIKF